ncbi:MAG: hypothetical protein WD038_03255 [Balneolales bacterium]
MILNQESEISTMGVKSIKSSEGKSKLYQWLLGAAVTVLMILLIVYITLLIVIDAGFVEERLNSQVQATGGLYSFDIESVDFSLANRSFQASGVSLSPTKPNLNKMPQDSLPSYQYELDMSGFSLNGINVLAFWGNNKIEMSSLQIDDPVISLMIDRDLPDGSGEEEEQEKAPLHARLSGQLPDIDIGDLSINNATLAVSYKENGETREQSIEGLNLAFKNIKVDSIAVQDEERILFSDDVRLNLDGFQGDSKDGVYRFNIGPVTASTREATFQIDDVSVLPTVSDVEFVNMKEVRESRYMFISDHISVEGINYRRLLDYQEVIVELVEINEYLLDVFSDLSLPRITPSQTPHETVQELGINLNIREIILNNGQINYSEQAENGIRPGFIMLDSTYVQIHNITNDPELMTIDEPASISVQTLLNGEGRLEALIELPLLATDFPIFFTGKMGQVNAKTFNSILVDLEGIQIVSGNIDSVIFNIQSTGGQGTGTVRAAYENLEIEALDAGEYERDFSHDLQTYIANNLLIRSSGDAVREGEVDVERNNMEDSFLNYLVDALIDGLISSIVRIV